MLRAASNDFWLLLSDKNWLNREVPSKNGLEDCKNADSQQAELAAMHTRTRSLNLVLEDTGTKTNRYGSQCGLPEFSKQRHVPVLGLINPKSGGQAGADILNICKRSPYYQDRFFNIVKVAKSQERGGVLDIFRMELVAACEEAKKLNTRARVLSGGGDGSASFSLSLIMQALKADDGRAAEGLADSGNGFIWTDEELHDLFPALVQLPLGTANDFGNILGWGKKYPGSKTNFGCGMTPAQQLAFWFEHALDRQAIVTSFDLWGVMPQPGSDRCDFKVCELVGPRGWNPKVPLAEGEQQQLVMREASVAVPFFVCLYFSVGLFGYVVSRFQLNRHKSPAANKAEYARQLCGIMLERRPPQLRQNLNAIRLHCDGEHYFPPRYQTGNTGNRYREVGFYNINWQAGLFHGADRGSLRHRLFSNRRPVTFNDGMLDMYRFRFSSILKNPGRRIQTDKKKDMLLHFSSEPGTGIFFQYDGEARFAFSPTSQDFSIYIRKVLTIPVVLGPYYNKKLTGDAENTEAIFEFVGDSEADRQQVKTRIFSLLDGSLPREINATEEELIAAHLTGPGVPQTFDGAESLNQEQSLRSSFWARR